MTEYSTYSDFYKVSFITTSSLNIPKLLKHTGGLIIMNNTDDFMCSVNTEHGNHHPKSLWFRGDMIASGYGALCEEERENLTYLAGTYNSLFDGIHDRFENATYWINSYNSYFLNAYSYTIDTTDRVKKESYCYTNSVIDNLIGCAPDTLDTLGEIAHWLEKDQAMGLDTVSHVKDIANSYVWHYPTTEASYWYNAPWQEENWDEVKSTYLPGGNVRFAYIADYSFASELTNTNYEPSHTDSNDGNVLINGTSVVKTWKNDNTYTLWKAADGAIFPFKANEDNTYTNVNGETVDIAAYQVIYEECSIDPGSINTAYTTINTQYDAILAMRDYQVSTHFASNPTLGTVLECLLEPYPYKTPEVTLVSYSPTYAEVGTTVNVQLNYEYKVNDSKQLLSIDGVSINNTESEGTHSSMLQNVAINQYGMQQNTIKSSYTYRYDDANEHYYTQLERAGIQHVCEYGKFPGGSTEAETNVNIYGLYKLYGDVLEPNGVLPQVENEVIPHNPQWIFDFDKNVGETFVEITDYTFSTNHNKLWFAIPDVYVFDVYLKNIHSDILQPINLNLDGQPMLGNANNILVYETYKTININRNVYNIVTLTNLRTTMANEYVLLFKLRRQSN